MIGVSRSLSRRGPALSGASDQHLRTQAASTACRRH